MANEIPNAVTLMKDPVLRDWVMAASVYVAGEVIAEATSVTDHAIRLQLADAVITSPVQHLDRFINVIACAADIASRGTVVGTDITQAVLIAKVNAVWTALAKVILTP